MPYQCKLVDIDELKKQGKRPQPGDIWYAPWYLHDDGTPVCNFFSPEYKRDWMGKRPPIVVCLPNGHHWMPDVKFSDLNGDFKENGWVVTGDIPNITAMPSINSTSVDHRTGYHGWLQNGVLSDDLEGRAYYL